MPEFVGQHSVNFVHLIQIVFGVDDIHAAMKIRHFRAQVIENQVTQPYVGAGTGA